MKRGAFCVRMYGGCLLAFAATVFGCSSGESDLGPVDAGGSDAAQGGSTMTGTPGFEHALCQKGYPARPCDGDPHGQWILAAACVNRFSDCAGAKVTVKGAVAATISFNEGMPDAYYQYEYDLDIERRVSVPLACLGGASCESIGCFAGDNPCSCVLGSSRGGSTSAKWTPVIGGEVTTGMADGMQSTPLRFCAGAMTADSIIGGTRLVWNRVCTENMDCRPTNPCHHGRAKCSAVALTCEDSGNNRPTGAICGQAKVCDSTGSCVDCAAGSACQPANEPCKTGTVSCQTAAPVCKVSGNVANGTACGDGKSCLDGVCKAANGAACTADSQCTEKCTCGDPQCLTRFCGKACPCRYASPGGECAGALEDGAQDPSSCSKACFQGRCLTEVGQRCNENKECGSGHCTCWLPNCSGGRLCSRVACPCQYAQSGAEACAGPLVDGAQDLGCGGTQMCVGGMCQ